MKRNQFKNATFVITHQSTGENGPIEILNWMKGATTPLRWILKKKAGKGKKYWSLLTNDLKLPARVIIELYSNRWTIEEVFKWIKQYTLLKKPLVNSWDGFILHCFFSILIYQLLLYFLTLLEVPRWQENLTEIRNQIINAPMKPWNFDFLRIPLAFLKLYPT